MSLLARLPVKACLPEMDPVLLGPVCLFMGVCLALVVCVSRVGFTDLSLVARALLEVLVRVLSASTFTCVR